jgi:L-lysine 6-transaminase
MITAHDVMPILRKHVLVDGYDFVVDLEKSHGSILVEARTGLEYLDLFTFFASLPLGMNHPGMTGDSEFTRILARAALHKVSNCDVYTPEYATFVDAFARTLGDPHLPHLFFIDGGALAVENALKIAFDWKAQRASAPPGGRPLRAMHMTGAFHGRSGYTLSLTNTDPIKTQFYPKWDWPRISLPAVPADPTPTETAMRDAADQSLAQARREFESGGGDVACFIVEPILGEGGDIHLSPRFLRGMQDLCHEFDALFIVDEVQTGCGLTGTAWAYQQLDIEPDVVAFGKKTQVCGVMAGRRVDLVRENVFRVSSRISSTWGGNLADMVRATRIFDIIERDSLISAAASNGAQLLNMLTQLAVRHPSLVSNPRGRGLMAAFDLPDVSARDLVVGRLLSDQCVLILPTGRRGIRFRPPLTVSAQELAQAVAAIDVVLREVAQDAAPESGA